jgi:hypothetical protein
MFFTASTLGKRMRPSPIPASDSGSGDYIGPLFAIKYDGFRSV